MVNRPSISGGRLEGVAGSPGIQSGALVSPAVRRAEAFGR